LDPRFKTLKRVEQVHRSLGATEMWRYDEQNAMNRPEPELLLFENA
jgi:hypothetical protein